MKKLELVLVVFGRTDIQRKFHPVAFMITSHEQINDYVFFYTILKWITTCLSLNLNIKYLMQDAYKSESTAISTLFPDAIILYCYFQQKLLVKLWKG